VNKFGQWGNFGFFIGKVGFGICFLEKTVYVRIEFIYL
jgi:hypothetical protein